MSSLAGLYNRDNSPANREDLMAMARCIAPRGPDGISSVIQSGVGMVQALLITTPEETPLASPLNIAQQFHIVADACLYNRDELIQRLSGNNSAALPEEPDSSLILRAYLKWGVNCPNYLVGDFAFAIWDSRESRLFLARDPIGIRQLYYAVDDKRLIFASDIKPILRVMSQSPTLNRALLQQILTLNPRSWVEETAYQGIVKLPPGHRLIANKTIKVERYYTLSGIKTETHQSDEDCIEQFQEVFHKAVTGRLRSVTSPGLVVSGGVDSSAVAAVVGHSYQTRGNALTHPTFYSYTGEDCSCCDDWPYLQQLLATYPNWRRHLIDGDDLWALKRAPADRGYTANEPEIDLTTRGWTDVAYAAKQEGVRVLLTGHGGDEVMLGDAYCTSSLMGSLPLIELCSEWRHFKAARKLSFLQLLARGLVKPGLKKTLPCALIARFNARRELGRVPPWISSASLDTRRNTPGHPHPVRADRYPVQQSGYHMAIDGAHQRAFSALDQVSGQFHVEHRYPFYDLRVLELLNTFPLRLFFRGGETKRVLRQATRGLIPDSLRNRSSYCTSHQWIEKGWRENEVATIKTYLRNSLAVDINLVDGRGLADAWERFWAGDDAEIWHLSAWINIESWLRSQYPLGNEILFSKR